jgi:hypothetical protein
MIMVAVLVISLAKQVTDPVNDRRQRQVLTWRQGTTWGRDQNEDGMRQPDQGGGVPVPGIPSADPVLVEPEGHVDLKPSLDAPAGTGHLDEGAQGYRSRRLAAVRGQFRLTEGATHQQLSAHFWRIQYSSLFGSHPATLVSLPGFFIPAGSSTLHHLHGQRVWSTIRDLGACNRSFANRQRSDTAGRLIYSRIEYRRSDV